MSNTSAWSEPISITSPSSPPQAIPFADTSPSSPSFPLSLHLSTTPLNRDPSRDFAGDPGTGLPPAVPPPIVACDNRLKITELARLMSDLLGLDAVRMPSAFRVSFSSRVVVSLAPADPGLGVSLPATSPLPMPVPTPVPTPGGVLCDDKDSDGPRKRFRACVGSDTGE